jgi:hypothetical protein
MMIGPSILTVVTPASTQSLVSLADARDELQAPPSADAFLNRAIRQVSAMLASYCDRVFIRETVSEQFRGTGFGPGLFSGYSFGPVFAPFTVASRNDPMVLRRFPVSEVISVVEDGVTLVVATDYEIDAQRGFVTRLWQDVQMPWLFDKLTIEYTAGYAADEVPDDLQDAVLRMITARYAARGRDPMLRSYSVPGVLEEAFWVGSPGNDGSGLPPEICGLLDQYREVRV